MPRARRTCDECVPAVPATGVPSFNNSAPSQVALDWVSRTADLRLDGALVASRVGFVSGAQDARMVHIFNSDHGVVWWDDFVIS